jgi:hypothetical protein
MTTIANMETFAEDAAMIYLDDSTRAKWFFHRSSMLGRTSSQHFTQMEQ